MANWKPDPTFYPSPRMAMQALAEKLAYVAILHVEGSKPDALGVVDLDLRSSSYGKLINRVVMPNAGDELHHFGWNACSTALCPYAPHPHVERRYLIVPGIRSSRRARYQARSAEPDLLQDHRAARDHREDGLQSPSYGALRA